MPKQSRPPHVRINAWRLENHYTQKAAAKLAGLLQGQWSFLERGEREPTLEQAFRLQKITRGTPHAVEAWEWLGDVALRPTG